MSNRRTVRREIAPKGLWEIEILEPIPAARGYYFKFRRPGEDAGWGVPFGYEGQPLDLLWDLPDNVCGVYIGSECFLLFRYGASRRRRREQYRLGEGNAFPEEEIQWFCAKDHRAKRASNG